MGFDSGIVSFRRYLAVGKAPSLIDQSLLDALAAHSLKPTEHGAPEETEYGWNGGRHVFDGQFTFERNVFGDALCFAIRVDTNRVPAEVKHAYQVMEEDAAAAGNPSGLVSKLQKRDAKDAVRRKIEDDLRSGQYRRCKLTPVLWDVASQTVYSPATPAVDEKLRELFERTFNLELQPVTAGTLAAQTYESHGKRRNYEDARPTRLVTGPDGEHQQPDYPWVVKGDEAKDFLGNEFLLWLWHEADRRDGYIQAGGSETAVMFDRAMELDCAFGATGKATLRNGDPTRMPEAAAALRTGKVPRKCGLTIQSAGAQYNLSFAAETFSVSALKLPEVPEADTPRVLFEERITLLRDFCKTLDGLYDAFLKVRMNGTWEGATTGLRRWIAAGRGGVKRELATVQG